MNNDLVDEAVTILRELPPEMQNAAARAIIETVTTLDDEVS